MATLERQAADQQSAAQKEAASLGTEVARLAACLDNEQAQARSLREQLTSVTGAADAELASAAHAQRALQQVWDSGVFRVGGVVWVGASSPYVWLVHVAWPLGVRDEVTYMAGVCNQPSRGVGTVTPVVGWTKQVQPWGSCNHPRLGSALWTCSRTCSGRAY